MSTDQWSVAVFCGYVWPRIIAMRYGLRGISTYGISGLTEGDEHPAYAPVGLSLLTSAGRELSTGHGAVMLCSWNSEGRMAHSG